MAMVVTSVDCEICTYKIYNASESNGELVEQNVTLPRLLAVADVYRDQVCLADDFCVQNQSIFVVKEIDA